MIARTIHQIWIGPRPRPTKWMAGWIVNHPGWKYRLWDEGRIDDLGLYNRGIYDAYMEDRNYNGAANVARVEILLAYPGVYLDADMECVRTLEGAPFLDWPFFTVWSPQAEGLRVQNAVIGIAEPNTMLLTNYRDEIAKVAIPRRNPSWKKTGASPMTLSVRRYNATRYVLPSMTFFPKNIKGRMRGEPQYAIHHYGTTNDSYAESHR